MTAIKNKMVIILSFLILVSHNNLSAQECPDAVPAHIFFRKESAITYYNTNLIPKLEQQGEIQILVVFPGLQTSHYDFYCVVKVVNKGAISYKKAIGNNREKDFKWEDLEAQKFDEFFTRAKKFTQSAVNLPSPQNSNLEKAGVPNNDCYLFCGPPWFFTICYIFNPIKDTKCGEMWNEVRKHAGYDE
jgi:hypothetical protein